MRTRKQFIKAINIGPDCWTWMKALDPAGYGRVGYNRRTYLAHRLSYLLFRGPIPTGQKVLHKCDNPQCVRPSHLFLGTQQDNIADKCSKGRTPKGETHCRSVLTTKEVEEIRSLYSTGNYFQWELANKFGITQPHVHNLVTLKKRI